MRYGTLYWQIALVNWADLADRAHQAASHSAQDRADAQDNALKHNSASAASAKTLREVTGQGNQTMKKTTLAALATSLCAATSAHAEKPTDSQTELIVSLAVITASVDRCHFEIDGRIIGLDLLKELMLIEDAPPGARYHYNMASALTTAANAVQGAYDEDPREWCESTWRNYGPEGVTKKGWITRKGGP
jgi:hypothetical protein